MKRVDQDVGEVDQGVEEVQERGYIFDDVAILEFLHWFLIEDYIFVQDMLDLG